MPRSTKYFVQYLGDESEKPGIMLMSATTGLFYDWIVDVFTPQPIHLTQPLKLQTIPRIPGTVQRFTYNIDTSKFINGLYIVIYVDSSGNIMPNTLGEYLVVYQGSSDFTIPPKTTVAITTEQP